jgi:hypothetical protein
LEKREHLDQCKGIRSGLKSNIFDRRQVVSGLLYVYTTASPDTNHGFAQMNKEGTFTILDKDVKK